MGVLGFDRLILYGAVVGSNRPPDHISKAHIAIRFNLRHFWSSVPSFTFGVLFKYSFTVLRGYFIHLNKFDGHFRCLSLAKIRDTVPLSPCSRENRLLTSNMKSPVLTPCTSACPPFSSSPKYCRAGNSVVGTKFSRGTCAVGENIKVSNNAIFTIYHCLSAWNSSDSSRVGTGTN